MKTTIYVVLILCMINIAGCTYKGKYINTRGVLDESIYYIEKDASNSDYAISSNSYGAGTEQATKIPQPALVDQNSTIQILIAKDRLKRGSSTGPQEKQSEELLRRKESIIEALQLLEKVVQARQKAIVTYQKKDLTEFYQAKKEASEIELSMIYNLMALWPSDSKEYSLLEDAYDPPSFDKLQIFLSKLIAEIEDANRAIENEFKTRGRALALEAFLSSRDKEPIAVHLDGYDSLKEESLARRDRFGLDLSKEERKRLDAHIKATQDMTAALERLRKGEATLNETVQQMQSMMLPQIAALIDESERLQQRLDLATLAKRTEETKKLLDAYFLIIRQKNSALFDSKKHDLELARTALLSDLHQEANNFLTSMLAWQAAAKSLKQDWQKVTPATMAGLIDKTVNVAKSFEAFRGKLPPVISEVQGKASIIVEQYVIGLAEAERDILLKSVEAQALRDNIEQYYVVFKDISDLITKAAASLSRLEQQPIAEMPPTTVSFQVPIENIKDTFINLEATPRLQGDSITVKATLKEGDTVIDTSIARFQVERYGHYAELSPAVVLVKPDQLQGEGDGFRFAPVLSWMHHWSPRPENADKRASVFRALDPALGIHSAFTNFRTDGASDTVQIGLGMTLSFWTNRLQIGAGYNLMAESRENGQYYYFIGSDLIGLLQSMGLAK